MVGLRGRREQRYTVASVTETLRAPLEIRRSTSVLKIIIILTEPGSRNKENKIKTANKTNINKSTRETNRQTETGRQTDRQTEKISQLERQTDRQRQGDRQTDRQRQGNRETKTDTERQTETDRQTETQRERERERGSERVPFQVP